ncbi:MAG: Lrp/AsnC family transcriptional regulator [Candidatus Diapherotrites archaeon]
MELDKTDIAIINLLTSDARLSLRKIAKKAGVSTATVMNRLRVLDKNGAIRKYSAIIDYPKIDFEFEAIVELKVSKGKLFQVEKKIASHPNVSAVYDVTGPSDVIVVARFRNRRGLDGFVKKIQTYDFVERTETKIILNTIKEEQLKL